MIQRQERIAAVLTLLLTAGGAWTAPGPTFAVEASATLPAVDPPRVAPGPVSVPAPTAKPDSKPTYQPKGRRDPFETLVVREGGSGPFVASAKLTGIVRGARGPIALVETADGLGYILRPGDTLGDGRLVEIGQDSVVFSVAPKRGSPTNRVVLRLPGD